jgi:PAS domain S-box-containing protein
VTTTVLPGGDHLVIVHDISERKRAELALSESEAKFAKIFHSSPIALSISYMSNGEIIDINASHTRVYGYTRADVVGRTSLQLGIFTPEERAAAVAILQEHGEMHNFPFVVHCKSGELKESLSSSAVIDLPQGRCLLSSTIDISALKRLDAAVRASEERLRWALDASNEGLWDWDLATGAVAGNDQWFRLFGYEPGETPSLINLWSSTLHPNDAPATLRILDDYLQDRRPDYCSEHRVVMKSGEVCWHQSVGKIVARDAAGRPVRMVGTNTDITLRKAAEMQLRDSEERFRLIVQNSPVPILIWDENAAIRYASPAFASVFGDAAQSMLAVAQALHACTAHLTDGDLSLAHLAASVSTQEAERWLPVLRAIRHCAQHPGDRMEIDINSPRSNGEWCDLHVIFQGFRNSAADVEIVSVIHDISEHRALQRLLEETNAELEQQVAVRTAELQASVTELRRANAGKDAFLAAISHELRTPLMGVLSMSELLASEERGPLNGHQAKYVDAITVSGERLLSTVNSVLLYTDLLAGNVPLTRELCHLDGLCAAAVRALQPDAERKQQHITQEIIPADLEIESDVQGLINVIKALLANAIKFTPAAGRIHLSARAMAEDEAGAIQIAVTDTGIGMSEAQISKLFRPFVQGDQTLARRFEGLGLGLAYVQKMVELLGGTTAVESELGKGSRITVTLPAK